MQPHSNSVELGDLARAELADQIDLQMRPLGATAIVALAPTIGQTVLDVGCGAGETVLQLADRVGRSGEVVGVDIAPRVLEIARARTGHLPNVTLLQADVATLALPAQSFDSVFSRFGTMFFSDAIAAFANFHRMLKSGGRIAFVCWRSFQENELDFFPVSAASIPLSIDSSPFSFEDADTIVHILHETRFKDIHIEAHDTQTCCGDVDATLKVVTRVGVLGKILRETPTLLPIIEPRVRAALSARAKNDKVSLGAATWIVTATAAAT